MSDQFRVDLQKEMLIFSAAHFITFETQDGRTICEQVHGHNYRVRCEVVGELNEHGYVIDFIALRDNLKDLVTALDHKMLVATEHPQILVDVSETEIELTFASKRWVFPRDDCALLPISNTTAELLAKYLVDQLMARNVIDSTISQIKLGVDENEGQWGECLRLLS